MNCIKNYRQSDWGGGLFKGIDIPVLATQVSQPGLFHRFSLITWRVARSSYAVDKQHTLISSKSLATDWSHVENKQLIMANPVE